METVKVKKQWKEVLIENIPEKYNYMRTRPFRSGPSRESIQDGGQKIVFQNIEMVRWYKSRNDYHQSYWNRSFETGNRKFSRENYAQKILPRTVSTGKVTRSLCIGEKSVFKSGHTKSLTGRVFKTFCKNVGKIDKESRNFANFDRIRNINVIKNLAKVCSNQKRIESLLFHW